MTLKNFESEVEPKIVERGRSYYRDDDVKRLEKVGGGEFSAIVFGTEKYTVYIKLNDETIVEHECDCPYDFGDVCKHKVAVFYAIRNGKFADINDKLNVLLENLDESALRKYVTNRSKKIRVFAANFCVNLMRDFEEDDEDFYDEDYY